jgi:hypothetical protein
MAVSENEFERLKDRVGDQNRRLKEVETSVNVLLWEKACKSLAQDEEREQT